MVIFHSYVNVYQRVDTAMRRLNIHELSYIDVAIIPATQHQRPKI